LRQDYQSWGRFFKFNHVVEKPAWVNETVGLIQNNDQTILPYGLGRSYGDSCLNDGCRLLDMSGLSRFICFDRERGLLRCEAGVTLEQILNLVIPAGWFLPVSPGTKFVTLAGAVANDVHGKNHHAKGTIGRYITWMKLLRTDGTIHELKPGDGLYCATIGGLGLTGIILELELSLIKELSWFDTENIKFSGLDEFFQISDESDRTHEYTVAWVDCVSTGADLGRGIFMRGNHSKDENLPLKIAKQKMVVPFDFPSFALSNLTVKAFNTLYYNRQISKNLFSTVHYDPFFYPLDMVHGWNRIYGKRGFFQYQFVIPTSEKMALREIFSRIARSGLGSFLAVLKKFGDMPSPGLLSFPTPGYTLALDFANQGQETDKLFSVIDRIVDDTGGRLYAAKDSKMSARQFQEYYPQFQSFKQWMDPGISSSFIRRVTHHE